MVTATVKLYASLQDYLPPGTENNSARVELPAEATIAAALAKLHVPPQHCHLVLLNGIFVPPSARTQKALQDGDTVAVWPPVAGG